MDPAFIIMGVTVIMMGLAALGLIVVLWGWISRLHGDFSVAQSAVTLASAQLSAIRRARFQVKPILNFGETEVFRAAEAAAGGMGGGYHAFPQVALGEMLRCAGEEAFRAINSKRCDVVLTNAQLVPVLAVEHQGTGHALGATWAMRDEIKRRALESAGVRYLAISACTPRAEVETKIREALGGNGKRSRRVTEIPATTP